MGLERGREDSLPLCRFPREGALRAQGLVVRQGGVNALHGVDFEVRAGEHVALVGPNGSGKTALLLALKGVVRPAQGRVLFVPGDPVAAHDLRVGMVLSNPEDQGVAPVVEDDVAFGLESLGLCPDEIRKRVDAVLRSVGLWDVRRAPVATLSGGQTQTLALAGVLALGARFLLLDEATAMLSPWERDDWMCRLWDLRQQGVGVVQVTHQADEVVWADRVVTLQGGRVSFSGTPEEYFAWDGCPWEAPAWLAIREVLRGRGDEPPHLAEVARWLRG